MARRWRVGRAPRARSAASRTSGKTGVRRSALGMPARLGETGRQVNSRYYDRRNTFDYFRYRLSMRDTARPRAPIPIEEPELQRPLEERGQPLSGSPGGVLQHHLPGHAAVPALDHVVRPLQIEELRVDAVVLYQEVLLKMLLDVGRRLGRPGDPAPVLATPLDE